MHDADWIDISVPLHTGIVHWPGDPEPIIERLSEIENGAEANVTFLRMSAHVGTHMDAPNHFLAHGQTIDQFPLQLGVGEARVFEIQDARQIDREQLERFAIQRGDRILFKTRHSHDRWFEREFAHDLTHITVDGAKFLAECGVTLVGIDYLSVGAFDGDGAATHRALLNAGVWLLEGLYLKDVQEGKYELICLPLRVKGADGAPARAIARRLN